MASTTTSETSILASVDAAEESLRQTPPRDFAELRSYSKPPLGCLAILEGVNILLNPSKQVSTWIDDKKLMSGGKDQFLGSLFGVDKDNISNKQLEKLHSILARDDCQPTALARVSSLCSSLCLWLIAIVQYATQRQEAQ